MFRFYLILCFVSFSACNVDSGQEMTSEYTSQNDNINTTSYTTEVNTTSSDGNTTDTTSAITTAIPQGTGVPSVPDFEWSF